MTLLIMGRLSYVLHEICLVVIITLLIYIRSDLYNILTLEPALLSYLENCAVNG